MALKRQKSKSPSKLMPQDKARSAAKQRRIDRQAAQETRNKENYVAAMSTPWKIAKAERHAKRKLQGKTYENWRKANSSRYDDTKPTASNLLVSEKRVQNHKLAVANKPVVAANGDIHYMGGTLIAGVDF